MSFKWATWPVASDLIPASCFAGAEGSLGALFLCRFAWASCFVIEAKRSNCSLVLPRIGAAARLGRKRRDVSSLWPSFRWRFIERCSTRERNSGRREQEDSSASMWDWRRRLSGGFNGLDTDSPCRCFDSGERYCPRAAESATRLATGLSERIRGGPGSLLAFNSRSGLSAADPPWRSEWPFGLVLLCVADPIRPSPLYGAFSRSACLR